MKTNKKSPFTGGVVELLTEEATTPSEMRGIHTQGIIIVVLILDEPILIMNLMINLLIKYMINIGIVMEFLQNWKLRKLGNCMVYRLWQCPKY